jgi:hypothetical protein
MRVPSHEGQDHGTIDLSCFSRQGAHFVGGGCPFHFLGLEHAAQVLKPLPHCILLLPHRRGVTTHLPSLCSYLLQSAPSWYHWSNQIWPIGLVDNSFVFVFVLLPGDVVSAPEACARSASMPVRKPETCSTDHGSSFYLPTPWSATCQAVSSGRVPYCRQSLGPRSYLDRHQPEVVCLTLLRHSVVINGTPAMPVNVFYRNDPLRGAASVLCWTGRQRLRPSCF